MKSLKALWPNLLGIRLDLIFRRFHLAPFEISSERTAPRLIKKLFLSRARFPHHQKKTFVKWSTQTRNRIFRKKMAARIDKKAAVVVFCPDERGYWISRWIKGSKPTALPPLFRSHSDFFSEKMINLWKTLAALQFRETAGSACLVAICGWKETATNELFKDLAKLQIQCFYPDRNLDFCAEEYSVRDYQRCRKTKGLM